MFPFSCMCWVFSVSCSPFELLTKPNPLVDEFQFSEYSYTIQLVDVVAVLQAEMIVIAAVDDRSRVDVVLPYWFVPGKFIVPLENVGLLYSVTSFPLPLKSNQVVPLPG